MVITDQNMVIQHLFLSKKVLFEPKKNVLLHSLQKIDTRKPSTLSVRSKESANRLYSRTVMDNVWQVMVFIWVIAFRKKCLLSGYAGIQAPVSPSIWDCELGRTGMEDFWDDDIEKSTDGALGYVPRESRLHPLLKQLEAGLQSYQLKIWVKIVG